MGSLGPLVLVTSLGIVGTVCSEGVLAVYAMSHQLGNSNIHIHQHISRRRSRSG